MHHPTAIIDPNSKIDEGVDIGPYSIIGPDVEIGSESVIESHVILKGPTKMGKRNHVFQFSTIGDGSPDKKYNNEPTNLVIGNDNIIREGVTIHRGTIQDSGTTILGDRNLMMAYSHIAHDCVLGDDVVLSNQAALAGSVKVGNGAILGGYAIVHQYCSLGEYCFCAMGSAVNKDIPSFVKVQGNPAKPFGVNTVGLKRLGFTSETLEAIKSAYRTFYRKKLTSKEALLELKESNSNDSLKEIESFIASIESSSRGIAR
jgi:UDP-N-acetylglucosamine acyltransferase